MLLSGIIWIIMEHSRSWSTFTLDAFLTIINMIYKYLFYHQTFDDLSIIINIIKLLAKKGGNIGLDNIVTIKIKI